MKKILFGLALASTTFTLISCSGSGNYLRLSTAGKMSLGIGSAVSAIQGIGGAMGTNGTFSVNSLNEVTTMSAATKCTIHAEPGDDANFDGVVSDGERLSASDNKYALQKFYCALASDSTGPESVSGAVNLIKTIACALDKQLGSLVFNDTPVAISSITLDATCASQAQIDNMSNSSGQATAVIPISGGAQVTASLNPTFSEIPGNTHYTHGIKILSNDGTSLKFIIVAKFNAAVLVDPIKSGDFEFATLGTGTMMQGTAVEFTAGKIYGASTTKHLWYESRSNRAKSGVSDPVCPGTSGSCGFLRHIRLSTDISFSNGDVENVSNLSGIMTDAGDSTGSSGQSDRINIVTAIGSLSTGLTGKVYDKSVAPSSLNGSSTLANTFSGGEIGVTSCIMSQGSAITTSCGSAPAPLAPTGPIQTFIAPANTTPTWLTNSSTKGGIGHSSTVSFEDEQFVNP